MRRRLAVGALAALLVAAGACGVPTDEVAQVDPDDSVPSGLLDAGTVVGTSIAPTPDTTEVSVCLVGRDSRLASVNRRFPSQVTADDVLRSVAQPPTQAEHAAGLNTLVSPELGASATTVTKGVAIVELTEDFAQGSTRDQLRAIAQIVCTLTNLRGIGQVRFEIGNSSADVPRGDGSTTSDPVSREDYAALMPPLAR